METEKIHTNGASGDYWGDSPGAAAYEDARVKPDATDNVRGAASLGDIYLSEGKHDEGHAACVRARANGKFRYCDAFGWTVYDGKCWTRGNAEAKVGQFIVDTLKERAKAGVDASDMELVKLSMPSASRVKAVKYIFQIMVSVDIVAFGDNPDLLNCDNGVIDLKTGELLSHDPEYGFTYCIPTAYHPDADQGKWRKFLQGAVGSDQAEFLQIAVGYSLTGHTREEILFYLHGASRAGKGTFTEAVQKMLGGDIAKSVSFRTFTADRTGDNQNFDLAMLRDCRFVSASESRSNERLNEAKIKNVTGGEDLQVAFKHKDPFNYRPKYKIWLASNHPVNADPDDDAVWGRVAVVHFPNSHLGSEDKSLKQSMKSKKASEGILAWAVEGAVGWYSLGNAGIKETMTGKMLKEKYRVAQDAVAKWMEDCCEVGADYVAPSSFAYQSYKTWCVENGVSPKQQNGLTETLRKKGFDTGRPYVAGKQQRSFLGFKVA